MSYDSVVCAVSSEHHNKERNLWVQAEPCHRRWKAQAAERGNLPLLSLSMHSCVWWVSVRLSDACPRATSHLLHRWVSLELGVLERYTSGDMLILKKERDVYSVTDGPHRVSEKEGGGGRDKCIKNGLVPLCHFVWWGSSGVIVTLTGTIKDVSFRGRGIRNDLLEGKVNPGLCLTFLNGGWNLSQCVSAENHTHNMILHYFLLRLGHHRKQTHHQNSLLTISMVKSEHFLLVYWQYLGTKTTQSVRGRVGVWVERTLMY